MAPRVKFEVDAEDVEDFGRVLHLWASATRKFEQDAELMFEGLGNDVANLILGQGSYKVNQISQRLGNDRFAKFMAERTAIDVEATNQGFHLEIYGLTEAQVGSGKDRGDKDYNLWSFYEFGGEVAERVSKTGQQIRKDAGSVAVIRQRANSFVSEGRKGAVNAVINSLLPRITTMMQAAITKYAKDKVASDAKKSLRKARSKNIKGIQILSDYGIQEIRLPKQVVEIIEGAVNSRGIRVPVGRGAKGRFVSLGNNVLKKIR